jgi:hypothetical protein
VSATLAMERERRDEPDILPVALSVALGVHLAVGWLTPEDETLPEPPAAPLEVDLGPAPPPPAQPEPVPERAPEASRAVRRVAPAPVTVKAAGKILAVESRVASNAAEAPLDFVTDPNGTSYGYGVVSRGGSNTSDGPKGASAAAGPSAAPIAAPAPALAAAADLSERPHLGVGDPCRGFFPAAASADAAAAVLRVVVEPNGKVRAVTLVSETPSGQGFGAAARECLRGQRFSNPRDHDGKAVATATTVRVRFER